MTSSQNYQQMVTMVEQKLDSYCDGDESDFGNLLGRTPDSIVRMIVKMMMVMARSQMFN